MSPHAQSAGTEPEYAYITLLTRASYLAGVAVLAHSLRKSGSNYPLIVLYTPSLPQSSVVALERESKTTNLILQEIQPLYPPRSSSTANGSTHDGLIAERFADTWTKLRVFDTTSHPAPYRKLCYIDADTLIMGDMDSVFSTSLPGHDWIGAVHCCVCNRDGDAWCPPHWTPANCAFSAQRHPAALDGGVPITSHSRDAHHLFNSGVFVFSPGAELRDAVMAFFEVQGGKGVLAEYKLPDQDFLCEFFRGCWVPLSWRFNAIKVMRYWHAEVWRDDEVVCLHYIVDKPWAARLGEDGTAGYLGRDGVTHKWWWDAFGEWEKEREGMGEAEVLREVRRNVAGGEGEESGDLKAIGARVQAFAPTKGQTSGHGGEADGGAVSAEKNRLATASLIEALKQNGDADPDEED